MCRFATAITLTAILLVFASCRKIREHYQPGKNGDCKIVRITQTSPTDINSNREGIFEYNEAGDLARVNFNGQDFGRWAAFDWIFHYDDNRRLTSIDRLLKPDDIFPRTSRITFTWENNRITQQLAELAGFDYFEQIFDSIVYDDQGRIVADYYLSLLFLARPDPYEQRDTAFYSYDSRGNRIFPDQQVQYTNRKSFLQTDQLLMFLHRNYSNNEAMPANGYTSEGWPTGFPADMSKPLPYYFFESPFLTNIEYACKEYVDNDIRLIK